MDYVTLNALAITVCAAAGLLVFRWAAKKTDQETRELIEQEKARKQAEQEDAQ